MPQQTDGEPGGGEECQATGEGQECQGTGQGQECQPLFRLPPLLPQVLRVRADTGLQVKASELSKRHATYDMQHMTCNI